MIRSLFKITAMVFIFFALVIFLVENITNLLHNSNRDLVVLYAIDPEYIVNGKDSTTFLIHDILHNLVFDVTPATDKKIVAGPIWSKDGKYIAFLSGTSSKDMYLNIMDFPGRNTQQLTDLPLYYQPLSWSSDSQYIAFSSFGDYENHIYTVNIETRQTKRLTYQNRWNDHPDWAPNGRFLVYETGDSDRHTDIGMVDLLNGKETKITTTDSEIESNPIFSPDGLTIAYLNDPGIATTLKTMDLNGNNSKLIASASALSFPHWSTDGKKIYATGSLRGNKVQLYVFNLDGSENQSIMISGYPFSIRP